MNSKVFKVLSLTVVLMFSTQLKSQSTQTLQLRPNSLNGYDTDIRDDNPAPNWLSDDLIANSWTAGGSAFNQRSMIKFDLSALPSDAIILNANLSLFCNTITGHHQHQSGNNACLLERIIQPWDQSTANWNNQPASTSTGAVTIPVSTYEFQDYPDINITNLVEFWHANPEQNYGMIMRLIEETQYNCMVFGSSDHVDETKRPLLVIEYIACSLPTNNFTYTNIGTAYQFTYTDSTTSEWHWNFGDQSSSNLQNPSHTYTRPGTYIVTLTAINQCGRTTMSDTLTVCDPPVADFVYRVDNQVVRFINMSQNADSWYWSFGNGFFSNLENPVYHFLEPGTYETCLLASNSCGSDIRCNRIVIEAYTNPQSTGTETEIETTPNPTSGELKVTSSPNHTILKIEISTTSGRIVQTLFPEAVASVSINISNLDSGAYIVKTITTQGEYSKLIIKE